MALALQEERKALMAVRPKNHDGAIAALQVQVETLTETIREYFEEAKQQRHQQTEATEDIRLKASHMQRSIDELVAWKGEVAPHLKEIQKWKERGIGAWMLIVAVSGGLIAAVTALWKVLLAKLGS